MGWASFLRLYWRPKHFGLFFPPIWWVFSLQISVHQNFPTYLPNYYSALKSIFSCKYYYLWVMCKISVKTILFSTWIRIYNLSYQNTPLYPLDHSRQKSLQKTLDIIKKNLVNFPNRIENEKFPSLYRITLFQRTKRYAEKMHLYGGKNKPVYWLKRKKDMTG